MEVNCEVSLTFMILSGQILQQMYFRLISILGYTEVIIVAVDFAVQSSSSVMLKSKTSSCIFLRNIFKSRYFNMSDNAILFYRVQLKNRRKSLRRTNCSLSTVLVQRFLERLVRARNEWPRQQIQFTKWYPSLWIISVSGELAEEGMGLLLRSHS